MTRTLGCARAVAPALLSLVPLLAQQPALLRDIHAQPGIPQSSNPREVAHTGGGRFLLAARTIATGEELFATDGVAGSTRLVADIAPGPASSLPSGFAPLAATTLFQADDGVHGTELWRSDGTAAGTGMVADIRPGSTGSITGDLVVAGSLVYFLADDGVHDTELWRSDGTAAGTGIVRDLGQSARPGVSRLTPFGSELLFVFDDFLGSGPQVWRTDGTAAGTRPVTANNGLVVLSMACVPAGPMLVLGFDATGTRDVRLDAIDAGTFAVRTITSFPGANVSMFAAAGPFRYLRVQTSSGTALWRSDGTAAGTAMVASGFEYLAGGDAVGSELFFLSGGRDLATLWRTDGNSHRAVQQIALAPGSGTLGPFASAGGRLLFAIDTPGIGSEPWASDGTAAGTGLLRDVLPGIFGSSVADLAVDPGSGSTLFVATDSDHGRELWMTDGTPAGTTLLADIEPLRPTLSSRPDDFAGSRSFVAFAADDGIHGRELWITDGVPGRATLLLHDIRPGGSGSGPNDLIEVGARAFFTADDGSHGRELWTIDLTAGGVRMVADLVPGTGNALPRELTALDDRRLAFGALRSASDPAYHLWVSDGTAAGTTRVDLGAARDPGALTALGNLLVFVARDDTHGLEPWVYDGTSARMLLDIRPGSQSSIATSPPAFTFVEFDGRLYFAADDGVHGQELWATDGTAAGTTLAVEVTPGSGSYLMLQLASAGGRLCFTIADPVVGWEPWVSDGTTAGTRLLADLVPGPGSANPRLFAEVDGHVTFLADGRLWRTNGTASGTQPLLEIGIVTTSPLSAQRIGSRAVWYRMGGRILRTDGTVAGSALLVADPDPATGPSPMLFPFGDRVLFARETLALGTEPWVLATGATALPVGRGCGDGARAPRLAGTDPVLGRTMRLRGERMPAGSVVALVLGGIAARPDYLPGLGCVLHLEPRGPFVAVPMMPAGGAFDLGARVPGEAVFAGVRLAAQALPLAAARLEASNGVLLTLGQ